MRSTVLISIGVLAAFLMAAHGQGETNQKETKPGIPAQCFKDLSWDMDKADMENSLGVKLKDVETDKYEAYYVDHYKIGGYEYQVAGGADSSPIRAA